MAWERDSPLEDLSNQVEECKLDPDACKQKVQDHGWANPEHPRQESNQERNGMNDGEENFRPKEDGNLQWAASAVKYEWKEEYGDVGPEDAELEEMLFGNEYRMRRGDNFSKCVAPGRSQRHVLTIRLTNISVTLESEEKVSPVVKFENAGLHPVMLENVKRCGYDIPTPIQAYVIPSVLMGKDIFGIAQTGSGKTAAFLVPVLSKLMGRAKELAAPRPDIGLGFSPEMAVQAEPLVLVVAPTRELATQIFDEARRLCYRSMLRPCVAYGGAPTRVQADELRKGCDILIATPGRLADFLRREGLLSLVRVRYTIIDEADEMVSPAWAEEMAQILGVETQNRREHVFMMFSATFPREARLLAKEYMAKDHIRIRVGRVGSTHMNIVQKIIEVDQDKKQDCLFDLLLALPPARTIVFCNSKAGVDEVDQFLFNRGLPSTSIHADRSQREREDSIRAFKSGKAPILVTTGVSARGLDIMGIMHVINYDLPSVMHGGIDEYTHRIGRTARIGNVGMATSFWNERNQDLADALTKVLIEQGQTVPDFLVQYKPAEGELLTFDDDSDNEGISAASKGESGAAGATDAWSSTLPTFAITSAEDNLEGQDVVELKRDSVKNGTSPAPSQDNHNDGWDMSNDANAGGW